MTIIANTIIKFTINHITVSCPKPWIRKQIIMPVHTKVKGIHVLQAAVIVNFRIFQLFDFPKALKITYFKQWEILPGYFMHTLF